MEYRSIPFLRVIPEPRFSGCETAPHFCYIFTGPGVTRINDVIMPYKAFERALDSGLDRIKSSLPKQFSSADFIQVANDCFPNEYAAIVRNTSYRTLHVWIARWYLNHRFKQLGSDTQIVTKMKNASYNKLWEK